jgi:hypothetical protein
MFLLLLLLLAAGAAPVSPIMCRCCRGRGTMLDLCYSETCIGPMGAENNWDDCGLDDTCGMRVAVCVHIREITSARLYAQ